MMHLCQLPMLLLVVGWTTVTHFSGVSPSSIFLDYLLYKIVQLELLQIRVNIFGLLQYSGNYMAPYSVLLRVLIDYPGVQVYSYSFAFDAPTVWNSLPEDIHASPTIASFKKKLKTYLHAKAYPP